MKPGGLRDVAQTLLLVLCPCLLWAREALPGTTPSEKPSSDCGTELGAVMAQVSMEPNFAWTSQLQFVFADFAPGLGFRP